MRLQTLLFGLSLALIGLVTQADFTGANPNTQIERLIKLNSKSTANASAASTSESLVKQKSYDDLLPANEEASKPQAKKTEVSK